MSFQLRCMGYNNIHVQSFRDERSTYIDGDVRVPGILVLVVTGGDGHHAVAAGLQAGKSGVQKFDTQGCDLTQKASFPFLAPGIFYSECIHEQNVRIRDGGSTADTGCTSSTRKKSRQQRKERTMAAKHVS